MTTYAEKVKALTDALSSAAQENDRERFVSAALAQLSFEDRLSFVGAVERAVAVSVDNWNPRKGLTPPQFFTEKEAAAYGAGLVAGRAGDRGWGTPSKIPTAAQRKRAEQQSKSATVKQKDNS